jgi:hypothetical protein
MALRLPLAIVFILIIEIGAVTGIVRAAAPTDSIKIERRHFVYHFDRPDYTMEADSVLTRARRTLINILRDSLPYKPAIYIVDDEKQFDRLAGGRIPDWGAAVAFPERKLIVIKSPDQYNLSRSLAELLAHEYSHLALSHRTGFIRPPRWLDEGLAMFVSMEWSWSDNLAMSRAGTFGKFVPLGEIEFVNRFNESKAHVAYAEAYLAVKYLHDQYGVNAFNRLINALASGQTENQALNGAIGGNLDEFDKEFEDYLKTRFNMASLFMDTLLFWLALAVIVVVGGFLNYRKRRRYYKKWEEEERLHSTDFDYGDPNRPEHIEDEDKPWEN